MEYVRAYTARRDPLRLWLMLICCTLVVQASTRGLCPPRCTCDDTTKSAACVAADLEVVPIQLDPEASRINLTRNRIQNLLFTLGFYTRLTYLDISYNRLEALGSKNFETNSDMTFLNVSSNAIAAVEKNDLTGLKALTTLDLDNNVISSIHPDAFRHLVNLQVLRLSSNRLVSFEDDLFKPLVNLVSLSLDNNKLLQIPTENLVYTINLEYLSMCSNIIESINESAAVSLRQLKRLELADNIISSIDHSALDGLVSLQYLNLNQNNLSAIPTAALSKLTNLTHLSLNENFFGDIPPVSFQSLFHLKHLHLSRLERVTRIDARAFVDNINLERIWMNDNLGVTSIPARTFHGNPRLTHISIRNNGLFTLHESYFPLEQLQSLQLGGNPLHCNCSLLWLWTLGHSKQISSLNNSNDVTSLYIDYPEIRCATPEPLENTPLISVPQSEIRCSLDWITIFTIVMSVSILISLTGSLLYYIGAIKRCSKEKKHAMADSDLTSNLPKMSNGLMYSTSQRPDDKVDINKYLMMAPQTHEAYHSTPPWHTMNKPPIEEDVLENMYQQFGYESIPHHKTIERPHIVYV